MPDETRTKVGNPTWYLRGQLVRTGIRLLMRYTVVTYREAPLEFNQSSAAIMNETMTGSWLVSWIKSLHGRVKLDLLDEIRIVHQLKPIAKRLAPTLYVVGENAMLNWNTKNDHQVQTRCDGGDGSKSLFDQLPNNPAFASFSLS
jgi:hypothetical protein